MRLPAAVLLCVCAIVLGAAIITSRRPSSSAVRPAPRLIVLLTVDALRADHLGIYGYPRPTSPAIDAFARDAIVIEEAIAQAPYTKASMASLMTGLYPTAHKTYTATATVADTMDGDAAEPVLRTDALPQAVTTLAEALRALGYATAALPTNPFLIADFGFDQGFDSYTFMGGDGFARADDVLTRALEIVDAHTEPLFLWVHLMEPHSPYDPPEEFRRELAPAGPPRAIPRDVDVPAYLASAPSRDVRVYEALYDAEIRTVDAAFGRFVAALRMRPAWKDTAIVLTSDHGEQFLEHGGLEHSTTLYDELLRVPLIVRVPGHTARRLDVQVQTIDVLPTLVALAGGEPPRRIHGRDMGPFLRGERVMEPQVAFAERAGEQYMVRTREWKLIAGPGDHRELYALRRDPAERQNLAQPGSRRLAELEPLVERILGSAVQVGAAISGEAAAVDPAIRRKLEALGYVQQ